MELSCALFDVGYKRLSADGHRLCSCSARRSCIEYLGVHRSIGRRCLQQDDGIYREYLFVSVFIVCRTDKSIS